jgi:hypothetical protein
MPREHRAIDLDPTLAGTAEPVPENGITEQLGRYVRSVYIGCYREYTGKFEYGLTHMASWDGGEDSFGRRHRPVWPKIAEKIIHLGVDPILFIRGQFWCRRDDTRPPLPTYLLSDEAEARYRAYLQQAPAVAQTEYEADLRMVQTEVLLLTSRLGWEYKRALRYALSSVVTVQASALFRFCLAAAEGLWDLAQHFHDQALLQYVFQQEVLDVAWGARIPLALREECLRLRAAILGRAIA